MNYYVIIYPGSYREMNLLFFIFLISFFILSGFMNFRSKSVALATHIIFKASEWSQNDRLFILYHLMGHLKVNENFAISPFRA